MRRRPDVEPSHNEQNQEQGQEQDPFQFHSWLTVAFSGTVFFFPQFSVTNVSYFLGCLQKIMWWWWAALFLGFLLAVLVSQNLYLQHQIDDLQRAIPDLVTRDEWFRQKLEADVDDEGSDTDEDELEVMQNRV